MVGGRIVTTTVTVLTTRTLSLESYDNLSTTIGLVVLGVLILVLLLRELVPLLRSHDARQETLALDMAVAPLLIAFAIIVIARLGELL